VFSNPQPDKDQTMPAAWFIVPYKRRPDTPQPTRYCAMDDFTGQIEKDGGAWAETEILGGHALVKVRAGADTLASIASAAGFFRLEKAAPGDSLADPAPAQTAALQDKLQALGYPLNEIRDCLGADIGLKTLLDVLKFAARRRLKPRYDAASDTIVCDGEAQSVRPIEDVDGAI
jgi:hypothetical protein